MSAKSKLSHAIMINFGTGNGEPTEKQLEAIIIELADIEKKHKRKPTNSEWRAIVSKYCPTAGRFKYAGMDNSDLNSLLAQAAALVNKK